MNLVNNMEREEALKIIRDTYHTEEEIKALETLIPELRESDDERIRKWLFDYAIETIAGLESDISLSTYDGIKGHDPDAEAELAQWQKARAYLEKQKEHFRDDTKMVEQKPAEWSEEDEVKEIIQQEQPEMDLEKEYQEFCKDCPFPWSSQYVNREYIDELCLSVARHFAEWGARHSINWGDVQLLDTFILELSREEKDGTDWGDSEKFYTEVLRRFHEFNDKKISEIVAEWGAEHARKEHK